MRDITRILGGDKVNKTHAIGALAPERPAAARASVFRLNSREGFVGQHVSFVGTGYVVRPSWL